MTVNKADGQTFEKVSIFLQEALFAYGQQFEAFLRAKSFSNIPVESFTTLCKRRHGDCMGLDGWVEEFYSVSAVGNVGHSPRGWGPRTMAPA